MILADTAISGNKIMDLPLICCIIKTQTAYISDGIIEADMSVTLSYVYFTTSFLLIVLSLYGLRHIAIHGARAFSLLSAAMAIYAGGYGFELLSTTAEEMLIWIRVEYIGCSFLPFLIMTFVRDYSGYKRFINKGSLLILGMMNLATLVIVNTNQLHGLYYSSTGVDHSMGFPLLETTWGIWYLIHLAVLYLVLVVSIIIIIAKTTKTHGKSRRKNLFVLTGFLVPVVSAVVYHLSKGDLNLDIVPLSFLVMAFLIMIGLLRYKITFLSEITNDVIFNFIEEALIALDPEGYIVMTNKATAGFFPELEDVRPGDSIDKYDFLRDLLHSENESQIEHNGKFYRSRLIPIDGFNGKLMVLSDITEYILIRKQLEFNATVDLLTGLYNRRFFMDYFRKIHRPGCIAFIDLDDFKSINDSFGHLSGDRVLSDLGACIKRTLPDMIACKYGGDEFIIIMQGVDIQEFKIRLISFADEYMKQKKLADCPFSAGISEYVPGDFESSVATTDKLLYRAKSLGKSRMVCSDGTIIEI